MVDQCPICSYEHLLRAKTYLLERGGAGTDRKRLIEKTEDAVRELLAAQDHVAEYEPEFAARIRDVRYQIEAPLFGEPIRDGSAAVDELVEKNRGMLPKAQDTPGAHKMIHAREVDQDDSNRSGGHSGEQDQVSSEAAPTHTNPGNPSHKIPKGIKPFAWTKCELAHPKLQGKIESCVIQLKGAAQVRNPWAVCRASIKCPPNPHPSEDFSDAEQDVKMT